MKSALRTVTALGAIIVPFVVAVYHADRRGGYDFGTRFSPAWLVVYGATFIVSAFIFGIPTLAKRPREAVFGSLVAAIAPLALASILFVVYDPQVPRFVLVTTPVGVGAVFLVASFANIVVVKASQRTDIVVAILDQDEAATFARDISGQRERRFSVIGTLDPAEVALDGPAALFESTRANNVNLIVLSEAAQQSESIVSQAAHMHERGIRVRSLAAFYDEWLGKLPLSELERTGMWFDIKDLHEQFYQRFKRLMDIAVAIAVAPFLALAIPFVLLANAVANRGPLFFSQDRVGFQGQTFRIHKFRTMLPNGRADGGGSWTAQDDPRITPVGRLLRRTHLDELPQIINVLRGDLSIVGPRPEQPHYVGELTEKVPFYDLRHAVRPGMTGWAQVKYPYGASVQDAIEKLQFDLYYLRHQSLSLDIRVCVRTFAGIALGRGR